MNNYSEAHTNFPADLVTFTEESFNGKLHFLCSAASGNRNWANNLIEKHNPYFSRTIKYVRTQNFPKN